jgi:drug/metabolite transporter (DMT)-like permease
MNRRRAHFLLNADNRTFEEDKLTVPVQNKDKLLRLALAENFLLSAAAGIAFLVAPGVISRFLGEAVPHWVMLLLGADLLLFAAFLLRQILRRPLKRGEAFLTIALDEVWVVASILLLVLAPHWFSASGQWLIGAVALAVAGIAVAQWLGLRRLDDRRRARHGAALLRQ